MLSAEWQVTGRLPLRSGGPSGKELEDSAEQIQVTSVCLVGSAEGTARWCVPGNSRSWACEREASVLESLLCEHGVMASESVWFLCGGLV